jgi:thiosulfate reductase cytochrome b subunit
MLITTGASFSTASSVLAALPHPAVIIELSAMNIASAVNTHLFAKHLFAQEGLNFVLLYFICENQCDLCNQW